MSCVIERPPTRTSAKVAQLLKSAVRKGFDPKDADRIMSKAKMSDHLIEIYNYLDTSKKYYITPESTIPSIKIHMGAKPRFFEQTSERELNENYGLPTFQLEPHTEENPIPPTILTHLMVSWNNRGENIMMLGGSSPSPRSEDYRWLTEMIYKYKYFPHLMVMSLHWVNEDNTEKLILRSELILIRLIVFKGRKDEKEPHDIIPALLISVRPYQYVIIEAYYDGKDVHENYGEPIAMSDKVPPKELDRGMKYVIGWATAQPCGKTASYEVSPKSFVGLIRMASFVRA
ncbi:hypothetical protein MGYG_09028 [Nannizzia gypsea CBS 118893]|uniref:Uncharacterized protein n=1 Tax=Arthroderma gypseum (strain ATCC MYA-4604 / CBS 118893) TaxID=535722 RepID=E4UTZ1_ARTGP|nr:hypothetical protein MGYG_09028 [Nannizzia gypsea CBS 118893]EFR00797.1 hypothetical protein MGYG_09028 [Nannizzia gypsea CBS 118893]